MSVHLAIAGQISRGNLHKYSRSTPLPPFPSIVITDMVAPGLRLPERPILEKYIKDGKLGIPYSFPFHKQPIKGLYVIYRFVLLLALLPLWIIRYALSSWRPRKSWTLTQALVVRAHSYHLLSSYFRGLIFHMSRTDSCVGYRQLVRGSVSLAGRIETIALFNFPPSRTTLASYSFRPLVPTLSLVTSKRMQIRPA
jgi:hypothetical protein